MKSIQFVLSAIIITLLFSFSKSDKIKTLSLGEEAPMRDFEMKSISDERISLESLKGERGTLVIFSCNTCPFVIGGDSFKGWEKDYSAIAEWSSRVGVNPILVNSNEAKRSKGDGLKDMKQRASEYNYTIPYALDKGHVLADAFGAKTTPHVFLFDSDWKLIYEGSIDNTWNPSVEKREDYLKDALVAVQNGSEIPTAKTAPKGCSIKRKS